MGFALKVVWLLSLLFIVGNAYAVDTCFDQPSTDLNTCGGHGLCTGPNTCMCLDLTSTNSVRFTSATKFSQGTYLKSSSGRYYMYFQDDANIVLVKSGVVVWALGTNQQAGYTDFEYRLGSDGSMTIYNSNGESIKSVAPACAAGVAPYTLVMQNDGYLVIHDSSGKTCWSTTYANQKIPSTDLNYVTWTGNNCSSFTCFGQSPNSSVCNNGICTALDTCTCKADYYGATCLDYTCHDIAATDVNACGGHGLCTGPNTCSCLDLTSTNSIRFTGATTFSQGTYLKSSSGRYYMYFQDDANIVLVKSGVVVWAVGTLQHSGPIKFEYRLGSDGSMTIYNSNGESIKSVAPACAAGVAPYTLVMQNDGYLVIHDSSGKTCWSTTYTNQQIPSIDLNYVTWTGNNCSSFTCFGQSPNSSVCNNGFCTSPDTCTCKAGYFGTTCSNYTCYGQDFNSSVCNNGTCTAPDTCTCKAGYFGYDCLGYTCFGKDFNSSVCNNGTCTALDTCTCKAGYYGPTCLNHNCFGQLETSSVCNNGSCTSPDTCTCKTGYYGTTCSNYNCYGQNSNSSVCNNGTCTAPDTCTCKAGYYGATCSNYNCFGIVYNDLKTCGGHGLCTGPNTCMCLDLTPSNSFRFSNETKFLQGTTLTSSSGRYIMIFQDDANIVLLQGGPVAWALGTTQKAGTVKFEYRLGSDGSLTIYNSNGESIKSVAPPCAAGVAPYTLVMQNDGYLVIYDSTGRKCWTPTYSTPVRPIISNDLNNALWTDSTCVSFTCFGKDVSSSVCNNGTCTSSNTCTCKTGYLGSTCSNYTCYGQLATSSVCNNGSCTAPDTCTCKTGYFGATCLNFTCFGKDISSSVCNNGACTAPDKCYCKAGYYGNTCLEYNCYGQKSNTSVCNNGSCTSPDTCTCKTGYYGTTCSNYNCYGQNSNSSVCNNGACTAPDTCTCKAGYYGATCLNYNYNCSGISYSDSKTCGGHGLCTGPNTCMCLDLTPSNSFRFSNETKFLQGTTLTSSSGRYIMIFQDDANIVLLQGGPVAWALGTTQKAGTVKFEYRLGSDGSMTIYNSNGESIKTVAPACAFGAAPYTLVMQNDGYLVIYDSTGRKCWTPTYSKLNQPISSTDSNSILWTDSSCVNFTCFGKDVSSSVCNNGTCTSPNTCTCETGYFGLSCSNYTCYGQLAVSSVCNNGSCTSPDTCTCKTGYFGTTCSNYNCYGQNSNSSVCNNGACTAPDKCNCKAGYYGNTCLEYNCYGQKSNTSVCNNGSCTSPDTCTCKTGYFGTTCSNYNCYGQNSNSSVCNNGACTAPDTCTCKAGYFGLSCLNYNYNCSGISYSDSKTCGGHGLCTGPNTCMCLDLTPSNSFRFSNETKFLQGTTLTSSSGRYIMIFQDDANIVLLQGGPVAWALGTTQKAGTVKFEYRLGSDGSMTIYNSNGVFIKSVAPACAFGAAPYTLVMQNDGYLVIYDSTGRKCWTPTYTKPFQPIISNDLNNALWTDSTCVSFTCFGKDVSSSVCNNGTCTSPNTCTCKTGYYGATCSNYTCFGKDFMSSVCNNGNCTSPDKCTCKAGYFGATCSNYTCFGQSANSSVCNNGSCTSPDKCSCKLGYFGNTCLEYNCHGKDSTSTVCNHGNCTSPDKCTCKSGYFGATCLNFTCFGKNSNSSVCNNGTCTALDTCTCNTGIYGQYCNNTVYTCFGKDSTSSVCNNGTCTALDICTCNTGMHGKYCNFTTICFNTNFDNSSVCRGAGLCTGNDTCLCLDFSSKNSRRFSSSILLPQGESLISSSGRFILKFLSEGQLTTYDSQNNNSVVWNSGPHNYGNCSQCVFEYWLNVDGSMQIFERNQYKQISNFVSGKCPSSGPYSLVLQNDGLLVLYGATGYKCWSSGNIPVTGVTNANGLLNAGPTCSPVTCFGQSQKSSVCNNGFCTSLDTCTCSAGYYGRTCSNHTCYGKIASSSVCNNGTCTALDTCTCKAGYYGPTCLDFTCFGKNQSGSPCNHGTCTSLDTCTCYPSYIGSNCSVLNLYNCYGKPQNDSSVCGGHGLCIGNNNCSCLDISKSNSLRVRSMSAQLSNMTSSSGRFSMLFTNGNMILSDGNKQLWYLNASVVASNYSYELSVDGSLLFNSKQVVGPCNGVPPFTAIMKNDGIFGIYDSSGFTCWSTTNEPVLTSNVLSWNGSQCDFTICFNKPSTSLVCNNGICTGPNTCTCNEGYWGSTCVCKAGYFGAKCSNYNCFGQNSNSSVCNNGVCTAPDTCTCKAGYYGPTCLNYNYNCSGVISTDLKTCGGHGICTGPNTCSCLDLTSTNSIRFTGATTFPQGTYLKSSSGRYYMYFQDDANIVLLQAGKIAWAFDTKERAGSIKFEYRLGSDGSLTIYNSNGVFINSVAPACAAGVAPFTLVMQNDGYLVIYDSTGRKCWTPSYSNSILKITSSDLNNMQWYGSVCNSTVYTCYGKLGTSSVCNYGSCTAPDTCTCKAGYFGKTCSSYTCFGKLSTDTSVCGGHGLCTALDTCTCKDGYNGSVCGDVLPVQCGGTLQTDTSVCSGHGLCTSYGVCTCLDMSSINTWNSGVVKYPSTLDSLSGRFSLDLQDDGNMVLYEGSKIVYSLGTTLKGPSTVVFVLDPDGSMYVKAYQQRAWILLKKVSGPCSGLSPYRAVLQDNGIFAIYSANGLTCWSTDNIPVSRGALTWSGNLCNVTYCYGQPSTSSVCNYGTCTSTGICACNPGYFGDTCSQFTCFGKDSSSSVCNHGTCTAFDTCTCNAGYIGKTCSNYTCFGKQPTSSVCNHGTCTSPDTCTCKDGYTGSNCLEFKCFGQDASSSVCNNGKCTVPDKCTCNEGYNGTRCELGSQNQCYGKLSNDPKVCSGHGICVGSNVCSCLDLTSSNSWNSGTNKSQQATITSTSGRYTLKLRNDGSIALFDGPNYFWSSPPSALTTYEYVFASDGSISSYNNSGKRVAAVIGACDSAGSAPFRAVLQNDGIFVIYGSNGYICWSSSDTPLIISSNSLFWNGSQCSYTTCFGEPSTSSVCNHGTCSAPDTCTCDSGYFGKTCSNYNCFGKDASSSVCNHGTCTARDTCTCYPGYIGKTCSDYTCFGEIANSSVCNNGICTGPDTCTCNNRYTGKVCTVPICFGQQATSSVCNHGTCIAPDTCTCNPGYNGIVCANYTCNGKLSNDTSVCGGHGICTGIDNCMCLDLTPTNSIRFTSATKFPQGTYLKSSSGRYYMYFQDDANIVLLQAGKIAWAFDTKERAGSIKFEYRLGSDGSLTIYNSNGVFIKSVAPACAAGVAPFTLVLQNDGYLVIYDSTGRKCWTPSYSNSILKITSSDLNNMQWYGSVCNSTVYTCYGKLGTSSVCNYGSCTAPDTCTCKAGYFGKTCSSYTCFGKLSNDTSVCGGHGLCTGIDNCMCLDLTPTNSIRFTSATTIPLGTSFTSSSGRYVMLFRDYANIVLVRDGLFLWDLGSDVFIDTSIEYRLGSDGSLSIYTDGVNVYSFAPTCAAGVAPFTLVLQNDGYLIIYDSTGKKCWSPSFDIDISSNDPNSAIWPELNCSPYTCFGQRSNSSICNHGTCTAHDTCTCNPGYFGKTCSNYTCFGQSATSSVCNYGRCVAPDTCQCENHYSGTVCNMPTCNGIPANDVSVCSSKGSCVSVDKCSCITGYTTVDSNKPCSSCLTGYSMNSSSLCAMSCPPEYSGPNCDVFTIEPSCSAIPSSSIPFCKSFISYRVSNTKYVVGATSDLSRKTLFAANLFTADQNTNSSYIQLLQKLQHLNLTCVNNCQNSIKKLLCYQTFTPCNQASLNSVEDKKWCSAVCNVIVNDEITYPSLFNNTCKALPSSNCYFGSYLPPSTTCYNLSFADSTVCSGKGTCIGQDSCSCKQGYSGNNCQYTVCYGKDSNTTGVCNGNGQCTAPNVCTCYAGYTAYDCSIPTCNGKTQVQGACSSNGLCTAPNTCQCYWNYEGTNCASCTSDFTGSTCSIPLCNNLPATDSDVCGGRGVCSSVAGVPTCICNSGFSGASCQNFSCNNIDRFSPNVCSGKGHCIASGVCQCSGNYDTTTYCSQCSRGYTGVGCTSKAACSSDLYCSSHGSCDSTFTKCICNGNWIGDYCDKCQSGFVGDNCQISCSSADTCNSRGTCKNDGTCSCNGNAVGTKCESCSTGWYGPNCDFQIVPSSFGFSKQGDSITGTVFSSFKTVDDCFSIITNTSTLGKDPICILNSAISQLQIILGSMATIGMGSTLQFRVFLNSPTTTLVTIQQKDYQVVPPVGLLIADKSQISKSCGSVYLDASGSVSLDRRQLKFTWKAIATPTESDSEYLNSVLSSVTTSGVSISGGLLSVGVYSIQVTVLSTFSQAQTIDSISFQVSDVSAPIVTLNEGLSSTYTIGTSSLITPLVTFPSCYNGTGIIQYSYSVAESRTDISIATNNEILVLSKDYTYISEEGEYFFTLQVSQTGAASTIISFKVVAIAAPLKLSFSTTGVSQSFETPVSFSLAKFDQSFPSSSDGDVSLSCVNLDTTSMCDGFSNQNSNIDQDTLKFNRKMVPGVYLFKAVFAKSGRSVSETVKFVILDQPSSGLIIVQIKDVGNIIDPSQDLVLQSVLSDSVSSSRVFTWSSPDFSFNPLATTLSNTYLVIPKVLLAYGASYTVKVSVVDGIRTGSASVHFIVDSPPTLGEFEIDPPMGTALVDSFKLKCGNGWTSPQQPLMFEYQYKIFNESTWKVLSSKSETKSISLTLPAGRMMVKAVVYNSLGTYTETTKTIDVSLPDNNVALIALQNNAKESTSTSSVSSALSVISQMTKTQQRGAPHQLSQLQQITSGFIHKYFDQSTAQQILSSITSDSVISMLSIISSASEAINAMDSDTISIVIGNFTNTISSVVKSTTIDLSTNEISFSHSSALTFQTYLSQQLSTNSRNNIQQFDSKTSSTLDLANINNILIDLLYCQLKTCVPDMPAIRGPSIDSYLYARLVSLPTLAGLSEIVNGISYFNISESITSLNVLDGVQNVKVLITVSNPINKEISFVSKLVDFRIMDSNNNQLKITSSSFVANITIESIPLTRSAITKLGCFEYNEEYVLSESCTIIDNQINSYTIQVQKTGIFIVALHQNQNVEESIITNPNLSALPPQAGVFVGVAFGILGFVIVCIVAVIVMSSLVRFIRKKQEKGKDKDIELEQVIFNTA